MELRKRFVILLMVLLVGLLSTKTRGENEGLVDLDEATQAKLVAKNLEDLAKVIEQLETSLQKGLDKENIGFAKRLLAATLTERASIITSALFSSRGRISQWKKMRELAMVDLDRAVELDDQQPATHYLIARLKGSFDGGEKDRDGALKSLAFVITSRDASDELLAKAYALRGNLWLQEAKYDQAIEDIDKSLQLDPNRAAIYESRAEASRMMKDYDEALEHLQKAIALDPRSVSSYIKRAQIYAAKKDKTAVLDELGKAIKVQPHAIQVLLLRANISKQTKDYEGALGDVQQVLQLRPGYLPALLLRSEIYVLSDRMDEAIEELRGLVQTRPKDTRFLFQLGSYYLLDAKKNESAQQYQAAIDVFDRILQEDKKNGQVRVIRGNTFLEIGNHEAAIDDFEKALTMWPKDGGLLNNFAWVLATSERDHLRDGKRAVELATRACELTDYSRSYILSTLAAAYAEIGDFDKAIEWSQKAVDLDEGPLKAQLASELQSYQAKRPWRELKMIDVPTGHQEDSATSIETSGSVDVADDAPR